MFESFGVRWPTGLTLGLTSLDVVGPVILAKRHALFGVKDSNIVNQSYDYSLQRRH